VTKDGDFAGSKFLHASLYAEGEIIGTSGTLRDVTTAVARAELAESEERFRACSKALEGIALSEKADCSINDSSPRCSATKSMSSSITHATCRP
jgi:hypothetical protein